MKALFILIAVVPLAGCSEYLDRKDTVFFGAGNAVETNIVTEVRDPWPLHAAQKNIAFSGDRMQRAVERYRTFDPEKSSQPPQVIINTR
jgi:hypothetical protein